MVIDTFSEITRLRQGWDAADRAYAEQAGRMTALEGEVAACRENAAADDLLIARLQDRAEQAEAEVGQLHATLQMKQSEVQK